MTGNLDDFRAELRDWLEQNCPDSMRTPMPPEEYPGGGRRAEFPNPDTRLWMQRMAERGFTVPSWPKEYGGAGLGRDENRVLTEELRRINARPPLLGMGISMIGPALLEFGNDEQKAEHLPKIARGEIWWCQGYSEPNAGSDLASLRTSAVVRSQSERQAEQSSAVRSQSERQAEQSSAEDQADYIINGQKIWTSGADKADWMFCLVRTDPKAPKHQGITFILFDMTTPGVSVRPIRLISGLSPFCETFLQDVRVPRRNVVGEVNKGWTVAKRLLQYERTSIGGIGGGQRTTALEELAADYVGKSHGRTPFGLALAERVHGRIADADLRAAILRHRMNDRAFALTMKRAQEESAAGTAPGAVSSMFKYYGTEQNKGRFELMMSITGTRGLGWAEPGFSPAELDITRGWLRSKGNSIEGGTSEVQLNIIAKRVLELLD